MAVVVGEEEEVGRTEEGGNRPVKEAGRYESYKSWRDELRARPAKWRSRGPVVSL